MSNPDWSLIPKTLIEAFNARQFAPLTKHISDQAIWTDMAFQAVYKGPWGYHEFLESWLESFPDGKIEAKIILSTDDFFVIEYVGRGTHLGTMQGPEGLLEPTGKCVVLDFCDVIRIQDGKVIEGRTYYDYDTLLRQVGVMQLRSVA